MKFKFKVSADLEGISHLIHGINYTIFTKKFEIDIPEEKVIERAFAVSRELFVVNHGGVELLLRNFYAKERLLHMVGEIGRSQSSDRVFKRLQELGWKFNPGAAAKMNLPPKTGLMDDKFLWERLTSQQHL